MATADVADEKLTTAAEGVKDEKVTTTAEHVPHIKLTTLKECKMLLRRLNRDHKIAVMELQRLERYVNDLIRRAGNSCRMGHLKQTIHNIIKQSVAKSVQDVYRNYVLYKRFQAEWVYNKVTHDLSSDQAFRRAISEINTQLMQDVHSLINENQEEFVPETKVTIADLAMMSDPSRSC